MNKTVLASGAVLISVAAFAVGFTAGYITCLEDLAKYKKSYNLPDDWVPTPKHAILIEVCGR